MDSRIDPERILLIQHTRCAMASDSGQALRARLSAAVGGFMYDVDIGRLEPVI